MEGEDLTASVVIVPIDTSDSPHAESTSGKDDQDSTPARTAPSLENVPRPRTRPLPTIREIMASLARRKQSQSTHSMTEIEPGLFLGTTSSTYSYDFLKEHNIFAVISMEEAFHMTWTSARFVSLVPPERHILIECRDTSTQNLLVHLKQVCEFLDEMMSLARQQASTQAQAPESDASIDGDGEAKSSVRALPGVLVHCRRGASRSATAVMAYLMRKHRKSLDEVLAEVRAKRQIKPSEAFLAQLKIWEQVRYQVWEDEEGTIPKPEYKAYLESRAAIMDSKGRIGNGPVRPIRSIGRA